MAPGICLESFLGDSWWPLDLGFPRLLGPLVSLMRNLALQYTTQTNNTHTEPATGIE